MELSGEFAGEWHVLPVSGEKAPSPREWREVFPEKSRPVLVWWEKEVDGEKLRGKNVLYFGGATKTGKVFPGTGTLVFINPDSGPEEFLAENFSEKVVVYFGEYAPKPGLSQWKKVSKVRIIEGVSSYWPEWPEIAKK